MSNQDPPPGEREQTPAERAGATPLNPDLFRATAAESAQREAMRQADHPARNADGTELAAPAVIRRPRSARSSRNRRPSRHGHRASSSSSAQCWLIAAACAATLGLLLGVVGYVTENDTELDSAAEAPLRLSTDLLSARRVAEFVVSPVAQRNLDTALAPILEAAPDETCLQVTDSKNPIFSYQASESLVPASNMKLLVAAAALDLLEPSARLSTKFFTDSRAGDASTVQGNLYIQGGGDPVLSTSSFAARPDRAGQVFTDLDKVADQIYDTGIRSITGSVIGDESRQDDKRAVASWPDRYTTQGQVAPLSALLVNDGVDEGGGIVTNPSLHAAAVVTDLLRSRGVIVQGDPKVGSTPQGTTELIQVFSPTVSELVTEALRFSDNTTTELLVKELGIAAGGTGSTAAGVAELQKWIAASGLPAEGVSLVDGSGLSPEDRMTCAFLAALVAQDGSDGVIATSLAVPGQPGTLDDRFLSEPLRSSLRAKTGTLLQVTGLSGWLRTTAERNLGFSLLINTGNRNVNSSDLTTQREILQALLSYPDAPALDSLIPLAPEPSRGQ